ncbi:MAG TPA: GAF domain-containing protein [Spongiibacteraceae bacterium]|nr:GAF domain-containing protein [Spongiibacteraceae bacterium]
MSITVDGIRRCLEGAIPATMATSAADGTPNAAYLSQVEYVDPQHIALSYQFFNKTRTNVLANPRAQMLLADPVTGATYRLDIEYLRTETEGALFERMKAKLAGIASHTGMAGIFKLLGSDVYRVHTIEQIGTAIEAPQPQRSVLAALRKSSEQLHQCGDLDALFNCTLQLLQHEFAIEHAMILMLDHSAQRLYAVASSGYENSGVGGEIALGTGVIGIAAQMRTPIRIGHMTSEYSYGRAIRAATAAAGFEQTLGTEIPLPGLPESRSQMAVPIAACTHLLGVLFVESPLDSRFSYDDEDALVALCAQLGLSMLQMQQPVEIESPPVAESPPLPSGQPIEIRYYAENASVFLDGDYLIKGVAGAIFWVLVQDFLAHGRRVFSNRQLRLDQRIRLPELSDNLEARLILLTKRLAERNSCVRIEKCGRGQFQLCVNRPLTLVAADTD